MTDIRVRSRKPNPPMENTLRIPWVDKVVIGVDASLTNTGMVVAGRGIFSPNSLVPPKKLRGAERLAWFYDRFNETSADLIVVEGYAFGAKMQREAMGELGGVLRLSLHQRGVPFIIVPPTSLKLFITGKGNGPKDNMSKEIYKRFGVDLTDNNQVDAAGLAIMGLATFGGFDLTEFQKRALEKLEK